MGCFTAKYRLIRRVFVPLRLKSVSILLTLAQVQE